MNLDAIDLDGYAEIQAIDDHVNMDVDGEGGSDDFSDTDRGNSNEDSGGRKHTPKKSVQKRPKKGLNSGRRSGPRADDARRAKAVQASFKAGGSKGQLTLGRHSGTAVLTRSKAKVLDE